MRAAMLPPGRIERRIARAMHRNAELNARHITVTIDEGIAVLRGTVGSRMQRDAAGWAAAGTPGILFVDNQLVIAPQAPYDTGDEDG